MTNDVAWPIKWLSLEEAEAMFPRSASTTPVALLLAEALRVFIPDVLIISAKGTVLTIATAATGKQIFDAEAWLRRETGVMYELMCGRLPDGNKLRVKLAKFRGIGDAT